MNPRLMVCLAASGLSACAAFNPAAVIPGKREATLASLEHRRVVIDDDQHIEDGREKAAATYRAALAATANPRMEAEALRRLADLELEFAEEALLDAGQMPRGDEFDDAIDIYGSVLARHADNPANDRVLYQLARALENAGREPEALATLDRLVSEFPQSPHRVEAQFRRGEMLFRARRYADAEAAYAAVIASGPDGGFHDPAQYKHGWSQFKQSLHEESLASFFALLDHQLVADGRLRNLADLGKARRELVEDSLRAVSISLSYFASPEDVDSWLERRDPVYLSLVYESLADLYASQERYADAARTLEAFVTLRPLHPRAPAFQLRVIDTWRQANFPSRELAARDVFVSRYVPDAAFWSANDPAAHAEVLTAVAMHLDELARHHHSHYQALSGRADQAGARQAHAESAIHYYGQSLAHFPEQKASARSSFLMAELLFELGRFAEASTAYEHAAYDFADFEQRDESAYAALLAYDAHLSGLDGEARLEWHDRAAASALRFADTFPAHPQTPAVLLDLATQAFTAGNNPQAIALAARVLTENSDTALQVAALVVTGHAQFELAEFAAAEVTYTQVLARLAADDERYVSLQEKRAAAVYRQGERAREAGDLVGAASAFARTAELLPGTEMAAAARYDAAGMLLEAEDWQGAAAMLEIFIASWPQHALAADARRLMVAAHDGGGDDVAAANALLVLADSSDDPEEREAALWQAGERFEGAGEKAAAIAALENYVERHPDHFDAATEARQRLVMLNEDEGREAERDRWRRELIAANAAAGSTATTRSRTLAAEAAMALAEPLIRDYQSVRIAAPLRQSLKRKKARMETALSALTAAAGYEIRAVTTRATHEIAALYGHMGEALLRSERPKELSAEELDEYELLLEEQAFPFEEKAIELYEANVARMRDGAWDEWVASSLEALAVLMPARYAKKESSEDVVPQMH